MTRGGVFLRGGLRDIIYHSDEARVRVEPLKIDATLQETPICLRRQKLSATTNRHGLGLGGASGGTLGRLMGQGVREDRGLALAALCESPTGSDL